MLPLTLSLLQVFEAQVGRALEVGCAHPFDHVTGFWVLISVLLSGSACILILWAWLVLVGTVDQMGPFVAQFWIQKERTPLDAASAAGSCGATTYLSDLDCGRLRLVEALTLRHA